MSRTVNEVQAPTIPAAVRRKTIRSASARTPAHTITMVRVTTAVKALITASVFSVPIVALAPHQRRRLQTRAPLATEALGAA